MSFVPGLCAMIELATSAVQYRTVTFVLPEENGEPTSAVISRIDVPNLADCSKDRTVTVMDEAPQDLEGMKKRFTHPTAVDSARAINITADLLDAGFTFLAVSHVMRPEVMARNGNIAGPMAIFAFIGAAVVSGCVTGCIKGLHNAGKTEEEKAAWIPERTLSARIVQRPFEREPGPWENTYLVQRIPISFKQVKKDMDAYIHSERVMGSCPD